MFGHVLEYVNRPKIIIRWNLAYSFILFNEKLNSKKNPRIPYSRPLEGVILKIASLNFFTDRNFDKNDKISVAAHYRAPIREPYNGVSLYIMITYFISLTAHGPISILSGIENFGVCIFA